MSRHFSLRYYLVSIKFFSFAESYSQPIKEESGEMVTIFWGGFTRHKRAHKV
jgi:hypothetical protein